MTTAQHIDFAAICRQTAHDALLAAHLHQEHGADAATVAAHAAQAALWTAAAEHHERTAEIRRQTLVDDFPAAGTPAGDLGHIAGLTDGPVHIGPVS